MYYGGEAAAVAQEAAFNATRSFGVVCTVEPEAFLNVVARIEDPLVVAAVGGFFAAEYRYLVSYKGFAFYTKSSYPLNLPAGTEVVFAKNLQIPT